MPTPVKSAYLAINQIPNTFTNRKHSVHCQSSWSLIFNDAENGCVAASMTVSKKPLIIDAKKAVNRTFPETINPVNINGAK